MPWTLRMTKSELEALISERYSSLPPKLKDAARYVLKEPKGVAIKSMRAVAADAKLQPATMLRFARQLGFDGYEEFRAIYVSWLSSNEMTFVARAKKVRRHRAGTGQEKLFAEIYDTEVGSLEQILSSTNVAAFDSAKTVLLAARRFYILGLRSVFPAAYYLDYACRLFSDKSVLITGVGGTIADEMRRANEKDALVAFSFAPYARLTVDAVQYAREKRIKIIAITDSLVSPIAQSASSVILAPISTLSLSPWTLPAMVVAHALVNLMVSAGGSATLGEVAKSDVQLKRLQAFADY